MDFFIADVLDDDQTARYMELAKYWDCTSREAAVICSKRFRAARETNPTVTRTEFTAWVVRSERRKAGITVNAS